MTILAALETAFIEMDAEVLEKQTAWALKRAVAVREFKASDEGRAMARNQYAYYDHLFSIAGGKSWYNVFSGRNDKMITEFVAKNCKAIADKRNATIVAKLAKIGVTEIGTLEYKRTNDGFNGVFSFNNAWIEIRTIIAGGYNIQCLHERTLIYMGGKKI